VERKWIWKVVFTVLLTALAALASVTTFVRKPAGAEAKDPVERLRGAFPGATLGLDLQGGLHLVYEVEVNAAVEDKRDRTADDIVRALAEKVEIKDVKIVRSKTELHKFDLVFKSETDRTSDDTRDTLVKFRDAVAVEMEEGATAHMALIDKYVDDTKELAVKQAVETIGNRIDELGLVNTTVQPRDVDIIVEIPGVDEVQTSRIKRIIGQTARLEFRIVDEVGSEAFFTGLSSKLEKDGPIKLLWEQVQVEGRIVKSYYLEAKDDAKAGRSGRQILKEFLKAYDVPQDDVIAFEENRTLDNMGNPTADVTWRTYFMYRAAGISGEYIENANVYNDNQTGQPYVALDFSKTGATIFEDLTAKNVKRRMAIQLDDKVQSAPTIQEKIPGGHCRITLGAYDSYQKLRQEAQDLVVVLRAGALPAPVRPMSEATVGPALGRDSISMSIYAFVAATLAVFLFMLVYYRVAGFAADIALLVNSFILVGIMGALGATLTLPGIAGIILTAGMAVDANVIIYERIREELRLGKSPRAAVDAGYKRAFWTIFDSHITNFVSGVVMLQYGTGPIKGFAITLLIGIVTSLFTSIFVSRVVMDFSTRHRTDHLSV
jgi:preprotein translocase subunit SecD